MFKKAVSMLLSATMAVTSITAFPVAVATVATLNTEEVKAAGWTQVWSDEFNGNALDTGIWNYDIGGSDGTGWGNNELQFYTNRWDNVQVADGMLKIIAKRENYSGCRFTSGRITTKGKKAFKYGKMEARMKVDGGNQNGVWPAFWMMGNDG
ncbi:MAG: glycoside hydrolase family 16 protein, partial [Lachnospiraceae bacterium]|nr:glycoside hydrolase family 16 protein [Lachnospiraceae bacterium]